MFWNKILRKCEEWEPQVVWRLFPGESDPVVYIYIAIPNGHRHTERSLH